jgi:hypothetical protein
MITAIAIATKVYVHFSHFILRVTQFQFFQPLFLLPVPMKFVFVFSLLCHRRRSWGGANTFCIIFLPASFLGEAEAVKSSTCGLLFVDLDLCACQ